MLLSTTLKRIFLFQENGCTDDTVLSDPNPDWSPEAVMDFYANTYDILTTAKVSGGKVVDDNWVYRFESVMGTKG